MRVDLMRVDLVAIDLMRIDLVTPSQGCVLSNQHMLCHSQHKGSDTQIFWVNKDVRQGSKRVIT